MPNRIDDLRKKNFAFAQAVEEIPGYRKVLLNFTVSEWMLGLAFATAMIGMTDVYEAAQAFDVVDFYRYLVEKYGHIANQNTRTLRVAAIVLIYEVRGSVWFYDSWARDLWGKEGGAE